MEPQATRAAMRDSERSETNARIEVRHLVKIYGHRAESTALPLLRQGVSKAEIQEQTGCTVAVSDVSFAVQPSETFVIMGLSGCGKSTVLRCLNRLIEPTAGEVLIDGQDIVHVSNETLRDIRRNKLAMVFQHFGLLPHRTVLENAAYGLEIRGLDEETRDKTAHEALEQVGLRGYENSRVQELSGGMQQRVGLARALATEADILLMDEAFSALDPLIRTQMQEELLDLQARMHKTIIFITHDLDEALKLGDRIAIMKDGRIVQTGTAEEILTRPQDSYVRSFVENVDRSRVLTAHSIMRRPKAVIHPGAGPRLAVWRMQKLGFPILFVIDANRQFRGAIRMERAVEHIHEGGKELATIVESDIPTAQPETPIDELLPWASESHDPIPVVDANRHLVGLITRTALLSAIAGERDANSSKQDE